MDIQEIAMKNYLDYYSENSYTQKEKLKAQKMVDAIDYIKKVSFTRVVEEDAIHQGIIKFKFSFLSSSSHDQGVIPNFFFIY